MRFGWSGPKGVLGVDVGSSRVKVVALSREGAELLSMGQADRGPIDVVGTLKSALQGMRPRTGPAVLAVPPQSAFVRRLSLPEMPIAELKAAVRLHPERYIPAAGSDTRFDVVRLNEPTSAGQMRVLVAAAPADAVRQLMKCAADAGLNPVAVDVEPCALFRTAVHWRLAEPDEAVAIVDMGSALVRIHLLEGAAPLLTRQVQRQEKQGDLFLQIRRSLEFALSHGSKPPRKLLLTGAGADLADLKVGLESYLIGPGTVRIPERFQVALLTDGAVEPGYALAVGLALAEVKGQ